MATTERPYWKASILHSRFFNNDKSKHSESKTKQEDILQSSILHSARLKKNLEESRKAFFNMEEQVKSLVNIDKEALEKPTQLSTVAEVAGNKKAMKKISFKIKKSASIYRKNFNNNRLSSVNVNSVAELTSRFNKLVTTKSVLDDAKFTKLVHKVNHQFISLKNKEDSSSAPKLAEQPQVYFVRMASVKRKASLRKFADLTSTKNKPEVGKVKATIEIFETITSRVSPTCESKEFPSQSANKPKVPEKKFGPAVIDIVNKNKERSSKMILAKQLKNHTKNEEVLIRNNTSALAESVKIIMAQTALDQKSLDASNMDIVQVVNIPLVTKHSESKYETLNVSKVSPKLLDRHNSSLNEEETSQPVKIPNKSFLWTRNMPEYPQIKLLEELEELYDKVDPTASPDIPPRPDHLHLPPDDTDKIYEDVVRVGSYEYCTSSTKYEELDDGYEYCQNVNEDNIYETLPTPKKSPANTASVPPPNLPPKKQQIPLPPRPPSRSHSFYSSQMDQEKISNCYESIYNASSKRFDLDSNYESIDECMSARVDQLSVWGSLSNASSDDKSNSLYVYGKCHSDRSDRSASDWVDLSDDNEQEDVQRDEMDSIVIVREKPKLGKRNSGWSQKCREQQKKAGPTSVDDDDDTDSDHIYESLCGTTPKEKESALPDQTAEEENDVYDSFDSDSECDFNLQKESPDNIDIANAKLPQLPVNQTSVSTIAKTLRKNFTKSFHKMTKRKSELDHTNGKSKQSNLYQNVAFASTTKPVETQTNAQLAIGHELLQQNQNAPYKKGSIFNKFRRSMTFVSDTFISESTVTTPTTDQPCSINNSQRPKSTFYLTDAIDFSTPDSSLLSNSTQTKTLAKAKSSLALPQRPHNPPPPAPNPPNNDQPNSNQLYTDSGLFKLDILNLNKRSRNTNWYADVGLYEQPTDLTNISPSTSNSSSTENSGGTTASAVSFTMNHDNVSMTLSDKIIDQDDCNRLQHREEFYNIRNETGCYNGNGDDKKTDKKSQRWLDEPLYQFYDAAILESEYKNSTQNFDYDGYEEVGKIRPSAMELIAPIKNSIGSVSRTLWCEVPEVLQSAVLSSLSETQQKIQEAKFEMLTSEASYLHSLNVLVDHFVKNIKHSELLTDYESKLLFGNIFSVKDCSEQLLVDLEKCWQDNILLTNICDIVNKHAECNFHVYVTFCENQIFLDSTLNKLKERLSFSRYLEQLERSTACHSLKLNSFLLLPMQRITRWRLLIDAVLKRLVVDDIEYVSSRNTMATLTKIAQQCNEAARNMERTLEMQQISKQLEFAKGVPPVHILDNGNNTINRFLIKSGSLTQMVAKTGDLKVTFGKRFTKIPLYLFLFNDILLITKPRSKDNYLVLHYCYRNFIEINAEDSLESLPLKNAQGRHLIFLTILENHEEKLVELLLSCESVSDKERWLEAILPRKSENPDEIIYENWDCPQVTAVHNYTACQPDEMSLVKGDVINVDKKLTDGWYHGEKISDNHVGWFPSNYTITITNQHVRARNLKMRYRLLAFSTNYILSNP